MPTGLLALQGNDEQGHFIRTGLKKMGVSTQFIKGEYIYVMVDSSYFIIHPNLYSG